MKKLFIIFSVLCVFQNILPMQKKKSERDLRSFLEKIKDTAAQEKYLNEQKDWQEYYLKLKVSKNDHDKMVRYLHTNNVQFDTQSEIEDIQWLQRLEEENPRGFTALLYYEACEAKRNS